MIKLLHLSSLEVSYIYLIYFGQILPSPSSVLFSILPHRLFHLENIYSVHFDVCCCKKKKYSKGFLAVLLSWVILDFSHLYLWFYSRGKLYVGFMWSLFGKNIYQLNTSLEILNWISIFLWLEAKTSFIRNANHLMTC